MAHILDLKGKKFGKLITLNVCDNRTKSGGAFWVCQCFCGNICKVSSTNLITKHTTSCGCKVKKLKGLWGSKTFNTYQSMLNRCYIKTHESYKNYGARGITVCSYWRKSFLNFFKDMGERPPEKTLDRIDNNKGYSKKNCKWSTNTEQHNNCRNTVRLEYGGKILTLSEWSSLCGIKKSVIYQRIFIYGWTIGKALTTPLLNKKKYV